MNKSKDLGTFSSNELCLMHVLVLFTGFVLGIIAAYFFNSIEFDFSGEIEKARNLGIVSKTVLSGYPKSKDILSYISILVFSLTFSMGLWGLWARKERRLFLKEIFSSDEKAPAKQTVVWIICLVVVSIFYLYSTFNINNFFTFIYNSYTKSWPFLGEEGINLAYAQNILSGGVYGRDFYCVYGPMLVYPLAWMMKLFGETVIVERVYTYILNLLAYGIVVYFLFLTIRTKAVFLFSSILYLLSYPLLLNGPHNSLLRVALGFLPILMLYLYLIDRNFILLAISGAFLGLSILFSQEVGLCAVISIVTVLLVNFARTRNYRIFLKESSIIIAGFIVSVSPMIIYFNLHNASASFIGDFFAGPKIYSLGYASLPFPDLKNLISNHFTGNISYLYWPIIVYIVALLYLLPQFVLNRINNRKLLLFTITIFGILLFRKALGRSGLAHVHFSAQPALIISFFLLDDSFSALLKGKKAVSRGCRFILTTGALLLILFPILNSRFISSKYSFALGEFTNFKTKFTVVDNGFQVPENDKTGGVYFERETASSIRKINVFLEDRTAPEDYVYFFPNEGAYYFLFDRNNPTRFPISYNAITTEHRKEAVRDLEDKKPEYVIYSLNTWRVDDIPESIQVPEIFKYLQEKYTIYKRLNGINVLKRIN